jgi:hypothetical protein
VSTGGGDVAGGADFGPTDTNREILDNLEKQLATARTDYENLVRNELPSFNKTLEAQSILPVTVTGGK